MIDVEAHLREIDARARMHGLSLYPFQRDGVRWLLREPPAALSPSKLLADEMGCVDGDATVRLSAAGRVVEAPLSVLFSWIESGLHRASDFRIRCLDTTTGKLTWALVARVLDKGHRAVVKLTLGSGNTLRLTPDHEVACATDGMGGQDPTAYFVRADELDNLGQHLVVSQAWRGSTGAVDDAVASVVPDGEAHVYDVACGPDGERNFIANGIVVHNCGKTVQVVGATPPRAPVAVICPSGVKWAWSKTYRLWRPEFAGKVVPDRQSWRWPRPSEVMVSNFEQLPVSRREVDALIKALCEMCGVKLPLNANGSALRPSAWTTEIRVHLRKELQLCGAAKQFPREWSRLNKWEHERKRVVQPYPGTLLVTDEVHRGKNPDAAVTKRIHELSQLVRLGGGRVWMLSGTPLKNNIDELWTVLQLAGLGTDEWDRETRSPLTAKGQFEIDLYDKGRIAERLRNVMLRRRIDDVIPDLPAVAWESIDCPLDPETTKLADEVVASLRAVGVDIETATLDAIATATMLKIPREMWSRLRRQLAVAKVPVLLDLCDDLRSAGVGAVVFCDHVAPLEVLFQRKGWGKVTGAESAEEKARVVELAQSNEILDVCVSIRAGGVGITLTKFRRSIFVDLPTVPADLDQAAARLRRIGSEPGGKPILHTRLVADHVIERRIDALLERKRILFSRTIDASALRPGEVA